MPCVPAPVLRVGLRVALHSLVGAHVPAATQRRRVERLIAPSPSDVRVRGDELGGVPVERLAPRAADPGRALLYLHGGGYVIGSPRTHRASAATLARAAGAHAVVPDYRLAPEHPHPAALDDALAVYRALLADGVAPERIAVAGDSAGGGLALALALTLRDAGEPLPAALGLICPWLDLGEGAVAGTGASDALLTPAVLRRWAAEYCAGHERTDPAVSPLRADLTGLPPIALHSAGDDPLSVHAERLEERARAAGAPLTHERHPGLWHIFHTFAGTLAAADDALARLGHALDERLAPPAFEPRVAIVGAGMSGICMATKLREAGVHDVTIHEKADEIGGTWRENRYPGLACDVPARFYSYSFAPNTDWSRPFAPGAEIQRYFLERAERVRDLVRFGSEVVAARWEDGRWALETRDGDTDHADVLICATGVLHRPRVAEMPGLDTFAGAAFHSARWDDSAPLDEARIAVIGTGSTGVQITSDLAYRARRLELFQRTPQWIMPLRNRPYSRLHRALYHRVPALARLAHHGYRRGFELFARAATEPGLQRRFTQWICRMYLRLGVHDPELRARLTPSDEPLCKRLVFSSEFYPAVQQDAVELVTEPIDHVEPRGIVTRDGRLHELDVIVLATGFDAHAFMRPMAIAGEGGVTLEEAWADGPRAYRTVAIPGFPNLFTLVGPHSPIGNYSVIAIAEAQADYALRWIDELRRGAVASVAPIQAATDEFNRDLRAALPRSVWATGCQSWYLGKDGLPELWPWRPERHRAILAEPVPEHFAIRQPDREAAPLPTG